MVTLEPVHKLLINIDLVMLRPFSVTVDNYGAITQVTNVAKELQLLEEFLKRKLAHFDMSHESAFLELWTCEGFQFLLNTKHIAKILDGIFGKTAWHGKVRYCSGTWTTKNFPKNFRGFKLDSNISFINHVNQELQLHCKQTVTPYNTRSLDKTFLSLHAAGRLDRAHIFDHLFKNHYDTSTAVYRHHQQAYYTKLRDDYEYSNHVNEAYDNIWEGTHPTLTSDDVLIYCYNELGEKVPTHFVNVTSETNFYEDSSTWFTEKTVLPIMHGQPFITSSTVGFYDMLHEFGFKTFSDYWDESFNNEPDHIKRLNKFLDTLDYIAATYNTPEKRQAAINDMSGILDHNRSIMQEFQQNDSGARKLSVLATGHADFI